MFLGPKRNYDDFRRQIRPEILPEFDELRKFCLSLGSNVTEDVRAHRVVFGKSISFRWFADLEPENNSILIKIQKDRKEPFATATASPGQSLDDIKSEIQEAYSLIR